MKTIQKYIYIILCSVALIILAAGISGKEMTPSVSFRIVNPDQMNAQEISVYDAQNGNLYVFLPTYADMEQTFVVVRGNNTFCLNETILADDMTCSGFELEKPYRFSVDNREIATLWFYRSSNVATMYVHTASGSMDSIHEDKEYEEHASLAIYTAEGKLDYYDKMIVLKGRGNTSWSRPKKPYTLTLRQSSPLLDMGSSRKWVLNSNGFDMTNLHNKIVYGFADAVSPNPAFAPDCTYVDLYLNGKYSGLYLLCQKIDAGYDHLNLGQEDYFFELTFSGRTWDSQSAFYISKRRSVDIVSPANCDKNHRGPLAAFISDFQTALYSETGVNPDSGWNWLEYIDMDSWARKYLIEEVFSNFDGGQASQYFWLDTSEQKLYAGPCWDYDFTFGQFFGTTWSTPCCLLAQRNWEEDISWYSVLCGQPAFMETVTRIYEMEFRPLLQRYIDEVIGSTASDIENAVFLDQLRWTLLYSETDSEATAEDMTEYLQKRIEFLDAIWLDQTDYCTITLWPEEIYNLCVPFGSPGTVIPETHLFGANGPWYIMETNELFDVTKPIITDVILSTQQTE